MTVQSKPPSSSARTAAVVAVAVLVVVAIAGIVLASRQSGPVDPPVVSPSPVAVAAVSPVTTPAAASAPTPVAANTLIFAADSDKLPADATAKIGSLVETARAGTQSVRMTARYSAGPSKGREKELATRRTNAVHRELMAGGVPGARLQVELIEMPAGTLSEAASQRVELSLR